MNRLEKAMNGRSSTNPTRTNRPTSAHTPNFGCMRVLRYDVNKDDKVSFEEIVAADHELRKEVQL